MELGSPTARSCGRRSRARRPSGSSSPRARGCVFAPSTRRSSDSLARGLPRLLSTLLVLGLLGGTAAAFAVTERLKLVPSPIIAPKVTSAASPVCDCPTKEARIRFGLRDADRLTVTVIDSDSRPCPHDRGRRAVLGRYRSGSYGTVEARPKACIASACTWPTRGGQSTSRTSCDSTRRRPSSTCSRLLRASSPDGDRNSDFVRVRFRLSERSRVVLAVDGKDVVRSTPRRAGEGKSSGTGVATPRTALARDRRDRSRRQPLRGDPHVGPVRFIELVRRQIGVPPGVRFGVGVSTEPSGTAGGSGHEPGARARGRLRCSRRHCPGGTR